jgi:plasmid stability protein
MPDILIRGVDQSVVERLKARAAANHTSLQFEAKEALESTVKYSRAEFLEIARASRARSAGRPQTDSTALIRETRDA